MSRRRSKKLQTLSSEEREAVFRQQRLEMVDRQIRRRGVSAPAVLEAMATVLRHCFVPENLWAEAYEDYPLPIGDDQTISQPYIVAFMTEKLGVGAGDRVLEVGAGSGYQAAVLAAMGCEVFSVEIVEPLAIAARDRLAVLGYDSIHVVHGNGYEGWPEHAPYDAAIGTAAAEDLPGALVEQLRTGGRLVLPIGTWSQSLYLIEKTESGPEERILLPVRFVPMTGG